MGVSFQNKMFFYVKKENSKIKQETCNQLSWALILWGKKSAVKHDQNKREKEEEIKYIYEETGKH